MKFTTKRLSHCYQSTICILGSIWRKYVLLPSSSFHLNPSLTSQRNLLAENSNFISPQGSLGDSCLATSKFYYSKRYSLFVFHQTDFSALLCISQGICFSISCLSVMLCCASCVGVRAIKQSRALLSPEGTETRQNFMELRHENASVEILKIIWALGVLSECEVNSRQWCIKLESLLIE